MPYLFLCRLRIVGAEAFLVAVDDADRRRVPFIRRSAVGAVIFGACWRGITASASVFHHFSDDLIPLSRCCRYRSTGRNLVSRRIRRKSYHFGIFLRIRIVYSFCHLSCTIPYILLGGKLVLMRYIR